jgi:hypothetical protein
MRRLLYNSYVDFYSFLSRLRFLWLFIFSMTTVYFFSLNSLKFSRILLFISFDFILIPIRCIFFYTQLNSNPFLINALFCHPYCLLAMSLWMFWVLVKIPRAQAHRDFTARPLVADRWNLPMESDHVIAI